MKLLPLILLFISLTVSSKELSVITYNTGLTKKVAIFPLVSHVKERSAKQAHIFFNQTELINPRDPFVLMLQEVWSKRSFKLFKKEAHKKGYYIIPENYKMVKNRGIVTLTNLEVKNYYFNAFTQDHPKINNRGVLVTEIDFNAEPLILFNTHTSYSGYEAPSEVNLSQFREIKNLIENYRDQRIILSGDFNSGPDLNSANSMYDQSEVLWHSTKTGIFGLLAPSLNHFTNINHRTWDQTNPLIRNSTFIIKMYNQMKNGTFGWEVKTASIDHIFGNTGKVISQKRILDQEIEIKKRSHKKSSEDHSIATRLSDHYGIQVILDI